MSANRSRPGGGGVPASSSNDRVPPHPVIIAVSVIISGRVRDRLELDVAHCVRCGRCHRHRAPVEWLGGLRTAPCGQRYILRVALPKRVAA